MCCMVTNISRGGVAFIYNDKGTCLKEKADLDLFYKKKAQVKNISIKVISDYPVHRKTILDIGKRRQCHAQFVGLIQSQVEQLDNFLMAIKVNRENSHSLYNIFLDFLYELKCAFGVYLKR